MLTRQVFTLLLVSLLASEFYITDVDAFIAKAIKKFFNWGRNDMSLPDYGKWIQYVPTEKKVPTLTSPTSTSTTAPAVAQTPNGSEKQAINQPAAPSGIANTDPGSALSVDKGSVDGSTLATANVKVDSTEKATLSAEKISIVSSVDSSALASVNARLDAIEKGISPANRDSADKSPLISVMARVDTTKKEISSADKVVADSSTVASVKSKVDSTKTGLSLAGRDVDSRSIGSVMARVDTTKKDILSSERGSVDTSPLSSVMPRVDNTKKDTLSADKGVADSSTLASVKSRMESTETGISRAGRDVDSRSIGSVMARVDTTKKDTLSANRGSVDTVPLSPVMAREDTTKKELSSADKVVDSSTLASVKPRMDSTETGISRAGRDVVIRAIKKGSVRAEVDAIEKKMKEIDFRNLTPLELKEIKKGIVTERRNAIQSQINKVFAVNPVEKPVSLSAFPVASSQPAVAVTDPTSPTGYKPQIQRMKELVEKLNGKTTSAISIPQTGSSPIDNTSSNPLPASLASPVSVASHVSSDSTKMKVWEQIKASVKKSQIKGRTRPMSPAHSASPVPSDEKWQHIKKTIRERKSKKHVAPNAVL